MENRSKKRVTLKKQVENHAQDIASNIYSGVGISVSINAVIDAYEKIFNFKPQFEIIPSKPEWINVERIHWDSKYNIGFGEDKQNRKHVLIIVSENSSIAAINNIIDYFHTTDHNIVGALDYRDLNIDSSVVVNVGKDRHFFNRNDTRGLDTLHPYFSLIEQGIQILNKNGFFANDLNYGDQYVFIKYSPMSPERYPKIKILEKDPNSKARIPDRIKPNPYANIKLLLGVAINNWALGLDKMWILQTVVSGNMIYKGFSPMENLSDSVNESIIDSLKKSVIIADNLLEDCNMDDLNTFIHDEIGVLLGCALSDAISIDDLFQLRVVIVP